MISGPADQKLPCLLSSVLTEHGNRFYGCRRPTASKRKQLRPIRGTEQEAQ